MEVKLEAYDTREKIVTLSGSSGHVYLPKEWVGKRVKILLIDPLDLKDV
jgi:putative transposon-encoded protein